MTDIVEEALKQHERIAPGTEIDWSVAFVTNQMVKGKIKSYGDGKYALINSAGPVYFAADKVVHISPS